MRSEVIGYPVAGRDHSETAADVELAHRILQAASAIYVIMFASRSPQMSEVGSAMDRVHDWMRELHDAVDSNASPTRAELRRATLSLDRAVVALQHLVGPATALDVSDRARESAACLQSAASLLERARNATGGRERFMANCCAADIQRIAESRTE